MATVHEDENTFFNRISLNYSYNEKRFRQKLRKQPEHTFCFQKRFSKSGVIYESWENKVEPDRPQTYYGACALRAG